MNTENKVAFIRIPKNASTSMYKHCVGTNVLTNKALLPLFKKHLRFHNYFHPSHAFLSESVRILGPEILKIPVFCITRNPFDRMASIYKFCHKISFGDTRIPIDIPHYKEHATNFEDFVKFCSSNQRNPNEIASLKQVDYLDVDHDITRLRFENLQEDFNKFILDNNIFGLEKALPKVNVSKGLPYREYYNEDTANLVREMWSRDFDELGYSKEL